MASRGLAQSRLLLLIYPQQYLFVNEKAAIQL
jgi:hypothetical protein